MNSDFGMIVVPLLNKDSVHAQQTIELEGKNDIIPYQHDSLHKDIRISTDCLFWPREIVDCLSNPQVCASESPGGLVKKHRLLISTSRVSDSVSLGQSLRICFSNKFTHGGMLLVLGPPSENQILNRPQILSSRSCRAAVFSYPC